MNKTINEQISRMKAMMEYSHTAGESNKSYSSVEYQSIAADGKTYGIVREGTKFYIKNSNKGGKTLVKEDFGYINGFMNRKKYEYSSYASAQKDFDLLMRSINEDVKNRDIITESWNTESNAKISEEATEAMRNEIKRQREIMANVSMIYENGNKTYSHNLNEACCKNKKKANEDNDPFQNEADDEFLTKDNIKKVSTKCGDAKKGCKDCKDANVEGSVACKKPKGGMAIREGEQTLSWNDSKDYVDDSNNAHIGDSAPFGKGDELTEEGAMHNQENVSTPAPGTNEVGDSQPFDETVKESIENFNGDGNDDDVEASDVENSDSEVSDVEGEDAFGDEDSDAEGEDAFGDEDYESVEDAGEEDAMSARLDSLENLVQLIADKLGVSEFEDDKLYDDEEGGEDAEDEYEVEMSDEDGEDEPEDDKEEDFEVYESYNYKKAMMKEEGHRLDVFGKHPAYRKQPFTLPKGRNNGKGVGNYDMNDSSVDNEAPYGQSIGCDSPFDDAICDAITESIKKILNKKKV